MSVSPPDRLRALLTKPGFVVMPAVWDGLSAKLSAAAGFETAFLSGSCVAASRLGGPDLDLISFAEMLDSFNMVRGAASQTLVLPPPWRPLRTQVFWYSPARIAGRRRASTRLWRASRCTSRKAPTSCF